MSVLQDIAIIVGMVSGVAGVVLGIVNYWQRWVSTHPRIVVRPGVWNRLDNNTGQIEKICVMEVCNVGQVTVVVAPPIGFLRKRGQKKGLFCPKPKSIDGVEWIKGELKPQHDMVLEFSFRTLPDSDTLGRAFAKTVIGDTFKASRLDMRRFVKELKEAHSAAGKAAGCPRNG